MLIESIQMIPWILMLFLGTSSLLRSPAGWIAVGKSGMVRVTDGALTFDYTVGEGLAVAALPLNGTDVSAMDAVRFWMKTDVPTALAVLINEKKPGGDYTAICWSTGNTWQRVELTPGDFHLNAGPNDARDPDGKLDLDAVQNMGVLDISSIFGAKADAGSPIVVESHVGKHSFSIKDFELLAGAGVARPPKTTIDNYATPQLQWLTLGGAELKPDGAGMRATYEQKDERSVVLLRQIAHVDLRGKESLAFEVASDKPAQLLLTFEELTPGKQQGPRYNLTLEVPGGGKVAHWEVLLSAFERGEDSPEDANGKLDLDQLKTFSILDITGTFSHETVKNSLWIGNIRAVGNAAP
jgi:hypothetical protein